jgi:hypothetical protein
MYTERNYCIFSTDEIYKIDFSQVHETSADTLRRSLDGTKTFVKWDGEAPPCVSLLQTALSYYSHPEMLDILSSPEWTSPFMNGDQGGN